MSKSGLCKALLFGDCFLLLSPDLHVLGSPDILVWGHHICGVITVVLFERSKCLLLLLHFIRLQHSHPSLARSPCAGVTRYTFTHSFTRQISMCWGHQIYLCGGIICGIITVVLFERSKCLLLLLHFIRLQHSHPSLARSPCARVTRYTCVGASYVGSSQSSCSRKANVSCSCFTSSVFSTHILHNTHNTSLHKRQANDSTAMH